MPHIELATINKKIEQTRVELQSLSACTDESIRTAMTMQLETRLNALMQERQEIEAASTKDTVTMRIYGENVETGKISSRILLSALGGFQAMLDSVANAMLHSPTSRGKIPNRIKDVTAFEVVGTFAGSFGIVMERPIVQPGFSSSDSELNRILSEMFSVLETVDDSDKLLSVISPFGKRTVTHYRQWLDNLQECGVNLELGWKDDSAGSRIMHITKEKAPGIISTLDTIDRIDNEEIILKGKLNGVNVRNHSFEMSVEGYGLVKGNALPETLMAILDKIGTEVSANLVKSVSLTKAGMEKTSWYLSRVE